MSPRGLRAAVIVAVVMAILLTAACVFGQGVLS